MNIANTLDALNELLHTEMDRRQFLLTIGLLLLGVMGLHALLRLPAHDGPHAPSGFGSGAYGGTKKGRA
ncbi:MAG: hypothetical protein ACR2M3_17530 [Thermomicrobiales bacterium]